MMARLQLSPTAEQQTDVRLRKGMKSFKTGFCEMNICHSTLRSESQELNVSFVGNQVRRIPSPAIVDLMGEKQSQKQTSRKLPHVTSDSKLEPTQTSGCVSGGEVEHLATERRRF